MYTNIDVYRSIAVDALAASERATAAHRRPKPDGAGGSIIVVDPDRVAFKQSMIAIAFAGMYLEALFFVVGTERLGRAVYLGHERETYEERLKRIGLVDQDLLDRCAAFRDARNELVHEKAEEQLGRPTLRVAQSEAMEALELIRDVAAVLNRPWSEA